MKVIDVENLYDSDREVNCPKGGFKSLRYLLESDNMGYTVTMTEIPKGLPQIWHYKNHLETCVCVKGRALLINLETEETYNIRPGVAYVLDKNDRHQFQALTDVTLICVFNPPLKGREVHKEDGSY
jgi:L-ectoine synthase